MASSPPGDDDSAVDRTFDIAEIFERILVHLDAAELARARRTSLRWERQILSSSRLKRQMFLSPTLDSEVISWDEDAVAVSQAPRLPRCDTPAGLTEIVELHPAITAIPHGPNFTDGRRGLEVILANDVNRILSWSRGQWHDMLLTQPPCRSVHVESLSAFGGSTHLLCPTGVTLGMIHEELSRMMQRESASADALGVAVVPWCFSSPVVTLVLHGVLSNHLPWVRRLRRQQ